MITKGGLVDSNDVHYYPPMNLKIIKAIDYKTAKIIVRPPCERASSSLSGAGSENSFGSMTVHALKYSVYESEDCDSHPPS